MWKVLGVVSVMQVFQLSRCIAKKNNALAMCVIN